MNASVSVICYRHKMLANGESPIMLRITKDGKRTMRSLGVSVNPAYWDFNKKEPKPNCPNKNLINKIILKTRLEFQEKLLEKKAHEEEFTTSSLIHEEKEEIKAKTVEEFYTSLIEELNYSISLLIALGCFTGLRISDILALRWKQILNVSEFTITEKKTGKQRTLRLNTQLQKHIAECYKHIKPIRVSAPILVSQKGTVFTVQRINVILKEVKRKYRLHVGNFSCHLLRKTFGRQVYTMNDNNAEFALVKFMELFNHSSIAITKRYLGLRQEEILETYACLTF